MQELFNKWYENEVIVLILFVCLNGILRHFQQYFSHIAAVSFIGGGSRSTRREPPTLGR